MRTDERWDGSDEQPNDPSWASPHVDGAWGRTANPNTADGELQNIAAFSSGLRRLTGPRRRAAHLVVWLILIAFGAAIIAGVIIIIAMW